jgi:ABC-type lipoprotein release transport system permease subunit
VPILLDIAATGVASVLLHPLRSAVSVAALVAVLLPYLVCLGLAKGVEEEAAAAVRFGSDLYISGSQFGLSVPLPRAAISQVAGIDGVTRVVPRVVGEVVLGKEHVHAVLVGLPPEAFSAWADVVEGEMPRSSGPNELVVGTAIARQLELRVGSPLPPFYHNERLGERVSRVVGLFKRDAPLWQAHLILTTLETASIIFDQPGLVTGLLVWCRPGGYEAEVARAIEQRLQFPSAQGDGVVRPRVIAREDLEAVLPRGLLHREGIFNLHFLLAFVVAILVLLVTSGLGLAERRREIGILKATGWQTDQILLRCFVESVCLSVAGACTSLVLAWVWLRVFNAYGVAALFVEGVETAPTFAVPFRLAPVPFLFAFLLSFVVVLSGSLYSCWRAATVAPREAMR